MVLVAKGWNVEIKFSFNISPTSLLFLFTLVLVSAGTRNVIYVHTIWGLTRDFTSYCVFTMTPLLDNKRWSEVGD